MLTHAHAQHEKKTSVCDGEVVDDDATIRARQSLIPGRSRPADAMTELAPEQLVHPLAVLSYAGCVAGAGALANCAALTALIRKSRCGLFSILIQLAIADIIILFGPGTLELWSRNEQTWSFGTVGCMIYRGLDVFTSTASVYLIIAAVLHTTATINIEVQTVNRRTKSCEDDELRSSRHSLVANSDSSTPPRTMNIDYKTIDTRVSVILPSVFVWILATSLSVPEFIIANTIKSSNNSEACVFLERSHGVNMHTMLALFNVYLPTTILWIASAVTIMKLRTKWSLAGFDNLGPALKLSLWLIASYMFLCLPRAVLTNYIMYSMPVANGNSNAFTVFESHTLLKFNFATTCIYLLASVLRPLLYIFLLPRLRRVIMPRTRTGEIDDV